mmetsp:Transcript_10223/g.15451  ORF Transcript_10223/g.15451 Transcript_10223/m.15451 type:complete len:679 (+) Transcript_10223:71-2107(+)
MAELTFVQKALKWGEESVGSRRKKDAELYEGLIVQVRCKESCPEEIKIKKAVLMALALHAPRLTGTGKHGRLLDAIFSVESTSAEILRGLSTILSSLASHKSTTVGRGFATLLRLAASGEASVEALEVIVDSLSALLTLCPQGIKELCREMKHQYPWSGKPVECHTAYVEVLLVLTERHDLLEAHVLELIVRRALEIDTMIGANDIMQSSMLPATNIQLDVKSQICQEVENLFELEEETSQVPPEQLPEPKKDKVKLSEIATKLDAIMLLLLRYLDLRLVASADALLAVMLDIFESVILHTHQSKFVQFAMFKVCASAPQHSSALIYLLLRLAVNTNRVTRLSAVAYLASFVCRAKTVDTKLAHSCASALFVWCETAAYQLGYLDTQRKQRNENDDDNQLARSFALATSIDDNLVNSPNSLKRQHLSTNLRSSSSGRKYEASGGDNQTVTPALFAALLQALLYLICFRGDEIFKDESTISVVNLLDGQRWYRLLAAGNADGFKRCDKRVKLEFFKACDRANHIFDRTTIQAIHTLAKPSVLPNDTERPFFFYPFDPYLLPKSRAYLGSDYRHWIEDDSDSDEDSAHHDRFTDQHSVDDSGYRSPGSVSSYHFARERAFNASPHSLSNSVMSIDGHAFTDPRIFTSHLSTLALTDARAQHSISERRPRLDSSSIGHESW